MKMKTVFFRAFLLAAIMCITGVINGQVMECDWDPYAPPLDPATESNVLGCTPLVSFDDYDLMAPFTVYVNVHFYANYNVTEGVQLANDLIGWMNNYLNNVPQCQIPGPNGIPQHVPIAKFDIQLYTDPSNANDLYGGIWFHQFQTGTGVYNNRVVDIHLLSSGGCFNGDSGAGQDVNVYGYSGGGSCTSTTSDLAGSARTILHEMGHSLDLHHSAWCNNQCRFVDIDPEAECGPNCPSSGVVCDGFNPDSVFCTPLGVYVPICTWSNSNNLMSQGWNERALTPCQWETVFNFVARRPNIKKYGWAENCTKFESPYYLPEGSNITWQNLMLLNRDIVVTKGSTLTINCEVRMAEDRRFVVHRGGKLIIDEGKITNLCPDTRWAGIAVHGNAAKEQPDPFGTQAADDAGILIIQNGSIIEHAADAILTTAPGWPWPDFEQYFGGVVYAESSEFIDNGRVAGFMRYDFENKSQFIDCLMKKTPESFGNAIGVTIWECDGINFEQNSFENLDRSAIYGIDYGATIVNNNQFINCERGVEVLSTYPFSSWLDIWGNYFSDNSVHILANSPKNRTGLRIYNNDFQKSDFGIWIEGSSRFFMRNNSFLDELWGAVSWQTGTFSNLIDNNSFEDTYHGIDIRGKNSFLQFTRNCWENTTNDVNIFSLVNGTLGEVRSTQGGAFSPADNCFASVNTSDISAPQSETIGFLYLAPNNVLPGSCYVPTNNLSDGGANNYQVVKVPGSEGACSENFDEDEETIKDSLISAHLEMQNSYQALQNNPGVVSYQRSYDDSKAKYDYREAMMFGQWLKDRNFTEVEAILSLDQSKEGQRNLIGLKMVQKDFANADSLLALYPGTTAEDLQFKAIQEINIQRLQGGTNFALTATQAADLKAIGDDQDTPIRGYAEALLSYLSGDPFEFSLSVGQGSRPFVNGANNHLDHAPYQLFPNPSSGAFTLLYPATISRQITLVGRIINVEGRVVYQFDLDGSGRQSLNVSSLIDGVYILQISDEHNPIFQRRLAIIH